MRNITPSHPQQSYFWFDKFGFSFLPFSSHIIETSVLVKICKRWPSWTSDRGSQLTCEQLHLLATKHFEINWRATTQVVESIVMYLWPGLCCALVQLCHALPQDGSRDSAAIRQSTTEMTRTRPVDLCNQFRSKEYNLYVGSSANITWLGKIFLIQFWKRNLNCLRKNQNNKQEVFNLQTFSFYILISTVSLHIKLCCSSAVSWRKMLTQVIVSWRLAQSFSLHEQFCGLRGSYLQFLHHSELFDVIITF